MGHGELETSSRAVERRRAVREKKQMALEAPLVAWSIARGVAGKAARMGATHRGMAIAGCAVRAFRRSHARGVATA